jgi:sucrose-6-phosphate hydrolase SacC (GH32 family)
LFHLIYQRSGASQAAEKMFGHAWSADLRRWTVDTLAFTVDTTAWNEAHVWSPNLLHHDGRDYLFYTGVDRNGDQSIGYVSAPILDTTNTEWDVTRTQVLRASDTRWAVVDPPAYSGQTQFRDPCVIDDPEHPGRVLMFYAAHDSVSAAAGLGGLAVGVARSEPGSLDHWQDLGYYRRTLQRYNNVHQLESPSVVRSLDPPICWSLLYTNAGTPPGETGKGTIRLHHLAPGYSLADTSYDGWSDNSTLMDYLHGEPAVFGWSGSEQLRIGGMDLLGGFTAWGPIYQGIALTKINWSGEDFTLSLPSVVSVDEYRSPARDVELSFSGGSAGSRQVEFLITSAGEIEARLEVFDVAGRRRAELLTGRLAAGTRIVAWPLGAAGERAVENGVYYARLAFPGGVRTATVVVSR